MGLLALKQLMSTQRERRRRQIRACNGSIISRSKRKKELYQDVEAPCGKRLRYSGPSLPEDMWRHIHSLMPLRDAARTACVSRAFLQSWRCHPNLTFNKNTLGLDDNACRNDFMRRIDHIMKNHAGISVKALQVDFFGFKDINACYRHINNWLQVAITPGIEEITLMLTNMKAKYKFACTLLSAEITNSLRYLKLGFCAFRPTVKLGPFKSLINLQLYSVRITGYELGCLLSNTLALELLELQYCPDIVSLKIRCLLVRLRSLKIFECPKLRVIESKAPNLRDFLFSAEDHVKLLFGESLELKTIFMCSPNLVAYACSEFLPSVPNIESLSIVSGREVVNTPMLPTKFLYLKYLSISLTGWSFSPGYDYCSLVSLLDASPSLETFVLIVTQQCMEHKSIFGGTSHLKQMPERLHNNLKSVKIIGFCSAKSLVELTCHILVNTTSLECLTLDTTSGAPRCSPNRPRCFPMGKGILKEAPRALMAIRMYIEGKVPSTVALNVLEPCNQCQDVGH